VVVQGERVRVGVVGLGLIAQAVHLPNLHTLRAQFRVTHVCDVSPGLAATIADELPGTIRSGADWHALVADPGVDAVLVLTPGSHGEIALAALACGKHVFAEKPLAYSVAEAQACSAAAQAAGRVLQVGYMKLYDPLLGRARRELAGLGDLAVVRVTVLHPTDECQFDHLAVHRAGPVVQDLVDRGTAYSADRVEEALGGSALGLRSVYENVLLGSVVHELSLLRGLGLGLPDRFDFVSIEPPVTRDVPASPPRILAVGRLPTGAQLQLSWNWVPDYPEYTEEVAVFGSAGRLYLDLAGPYLAHHRSRLRVQTAQSGLRQDVVHFAGHTTAFVHELESFASSIRTGSPPLSDAAGAAQDVACLQALVVQAGTPRGLAVGGEAGRLAEGVPA
jgi:predicted dehydrogenase